jgi:hypothetical protein
MRQKLMSIRTRGGATVEITAEPDYGQGIAKAICGGCPDKRDITAEPDKHGEVAIDWKPLRKWAEQHARSCQGLPRR